MSANIKDIQTKVATLKSMFPEWSEDELKEALVQYKGDVEDVVDKILGGLITPWEKLEKNSNNNKQSSQNTSHIVGATRPNATANTTSTSTSSNFRNSTFKTNKAPTTSKFNSNHVGTKPAQSIRNTGSNASLKKPATSQTQNSSISKPTSVSTGTRKTESALEQLQKYKNFKVLNEEEVDDLTWADKMTYKKKLKEFNILQEQAKEEIEKKKVEDELKEKEAKLKAAEAPVVEETEVEAEPVKEEVKEEEEEEEEEKEESAPAPEQAPVEAEQEEPAAEAVAESTNNQSNLLGDYSNMKSAVEGINTQPQVGTPSSQFQQASQPFMGYNGVPNYSQYNQGFMPQNQMYPNNFADQMAMYNQFIAYNHFQQMQYMQQQPQQPGSATSTAPNTAPGESPSQQTYDFASGRQMMGMQQPQFMQNTYPVYGGYGQYAGQQPIPGQEDQQQSQQGSEIPQSQDQFAYYQHQMQQPYGQQNYYNMNQNYNQY